MGQGIENFKEFFINLKKFLNLKKKIILKNLKF